MTYSYTSLFFGLFFAVEYVVAQSLPPCAQVCVESTKTNCKSTDYACACSDGKYMPKLTKCINKICNEEAQAAAHEFLGSLCATVGYPIDDLIDPETVQIELRANIAERQFESIISDSGDFTTFESATGSPTSAPTGIANPAAATASSSSGSDTNGGGEGGGLSTGAKIGIGIGVPLAVGIIAGLVGIAFWLGRKSKKENSAATSGYPPPQQQMGQMPVYPRAPQVVMGPAEKDQGAQYIGHEMPTKGNTAEMPVGSPSPGVVIPQAYPQPGHMWPSLQASQPFVPAYPRQVTVQNPQPAQQMYYPAPGQQWPQQVQQSPASELPGKQ